MIDSPDSGSSLHPLGRDGASLADSFSNVPRVVELDEKSSEEQAAALPLDYEEFEALQRRRKTVHTRMVWVAVALATICIPIGYLQLTGQFSTVNLLSTARRASHSRFGQNLRVYGDTPKPKLSPLEQARYDRIRSDLTDYVTREVPALQPDEKIAVIAFANVTGGNFKDTIATVQSVRADVIPAQERLIARAAAIHPKTEEVRALNETLLLSARMRLAAYRQMTNAASDPDALWQYAFKAYLSAAEDGARQYREQLTHLAVENDVKLP